MFCKTNICREEGLPYAVYIPTREEIKPQEEICNTTGSEPVYILPTVFYPQSFIFTPTTVRLSTLSSGMT
jgi:hypothetical protein